jgi:hypothetical protein
MRVPMVDKTAGLITVSLAGLSWVDKIDLILRWGAAGTAIVVGAVTLYQKFKR